MAIRAVTMLGPFISHVALPDCGVLDVQMFAHST
jgi:hypothetical protein